MPMKALRGVGCFVGCSVDLTWPMAKLSTFWDYIFSRENKVLTFISVYFRVHWLSE